MVVVGWQGGVVDAGMGRLPWVYRKVIGVLRNKFQGLSYGRNTIRP